MHATTSVSSPVARLEDAEVGDDDADVVARRLVVKSSRATNVRVECRSITKTSLTPSAISGAPPPPGRRTFGFA